MKMFIFNLRRRWIIPKTIFIKEKTVMLFSVDNSGEANPFDWYHARFNVNFKLQLLAGGPVTANVGNGTAAEDANAQSGIVNSSFSLINKLNVKMSSVDVYDCQDSNQATNIKNLLEYSKSYSNSQGKNEFFYLDTVRNTGVFEFPIKLVKAHATNHGNNENDATSVSGLRNAAYNKGFADRKALLVNNAVVNAEIPLNRYSFFESLYDKILPNSRLDIEIEFESDNNLVWRTGGADCLVVVTKFELIVPRLIFNANGKSLYLKNYVNITEPIKWTYLKELIIKQNSTQQQNGNFRISTGVIRPRHVFVFIINDASINSQTNNKFLYNTFSVSTDPRTLTSCYLEVGNGKRYPEVQYKPTEEPTRVFRDVLKYVHANSEYSNDTLLNRSNFGSIFSFIHFDLTKQPIDVRDSMTKLTFHYELSGATATAYSCYALVLNEQDVEMRIIDTKFILRSKS